MVTSRFTVSLAVIAATLAGCGGDDGGNGSPHATALFSVPRPDSTQSDFFALPFPNQLRMKPGRGIDLTGLTTRGPLIELLRDLVSADATGASMNGAVFFRFSSHIDPATLPAYGPGTPDSSIFIIDIDPASPQRGQRAVIKVKYDPLATNYIGDDNLAILPYPGFPLREATTYAAIITTKVKTPAGFPVDIAPDLRALLDPALPSDATLAAAWPQYAPLRDYIASGGLALGDIAGATLFTTQRATDIMAKLRQVVYRDFPAPPVQPVLNRMEETGTYVLYEGRVDGPNFQLGTPPYTQPGDGGEIQMDANGDPKIVRTESLRFAITVPKGTMPRTGWPIAIYAHGTGGNYRSFVGDSIGSELAEVRDGRDQVVARIACISIDQVLHGPRKVDPNASTELTFFNFNNPVAFRDNIKQGALDDFQIVRFVEGINTTDAGNGAPIKFDRTRIFFSGHSQGGLTGPLFVAAEPKIKAAIFSGAGGVAMLSLLGKTKPVDIKALVNLLIDDGPLDEFHPLLTLIQTYMDSSDPVNYARLITTEPPEGQTPRHVFQSLGVVDTFTPVPTIMALATAFRASPVEPLPEALPGMPFANIQPLSGSVKENLDVGGTKITATLTEYVAQGYDGHFVVFRDSRGIRQAKNFLGTLVRDGVPTVVP